MLHQSAYDQIVAARLEEFWAWFTPWHRRLWNLGTVASLRELLEACEALPSNALKALQAEVSRLAGPDPAVGDGVSKEALRRVLNDDITFGRAGWHELQQLTAVVENGYVGRWAALLERADAPGAERLARSVAGHLLHAGFSPTYLHRWLVYQTKHRSEMLSIADLLEEAEKDLIGQPIHEFKVVVPVLGAPAIGGQAPPEWRTPGQIMDIIREIQGKKPELRQNGGFVLAFKARDVFGAVEQARELVDRWDARAELSTRKRILRTEQAWVEGVSEPIPFTPIRRQVDIGAIYREGQIYTATAAQDELSVRIDDALQLVQPMEAGHRSAAISGGWAAIEALLTEGEESEHSAARRLAAIIACSYPRAELTTLSYFHSKYSHEPLAADIGSEPENLQRARKIAEAISRGNSLAGRGPRDEAAYARMSELLAQPRPTLQRVRSYLEVALSRLYRQRNLTLHGGRVTGDFRTFTLATVPPLVGAGLDRVVHAWLAEKTRPVELAARAALGIELVGTPGGRHPTELLEPP